MGQNERRRHHRATQMIECRLDGASARTATRISDLSLAGCFVDTINLMPLGSHITLHARYGAQDVALTGRVVRVQRMSGMGFAVEFDGLSQEARSFLERIVREEHG